MAIIAATVVVFRGIGGYGSTEMSGHDNVQAGFHTETDVPVRYQCVGKSAGDILQLINDQFSLNTYTTRLQQQQLRIQNKFPKSDLVERIALERELSLLQIRTDATKRYYTEKKHTLSAAYLALCELRDLFSIATVNAAHVDLARGNVDQASRLFASVEARYRNARETDKLNKAAEAVYQLGKIAEDNIDYRKAYRHFRKASYYNPDNIDYLMDAARVADSLALYKNAIYFYQDALRIYKKNPQLQPDKFQRIYHGLGRAWSSKGEWGKAIECYETVLKFFGENPGGAQHHIAASHNYLGLAWESKGNPEKAIVHYKEALKRFESVFGQEHAATQSAKNSLKRVTVKINNMAGER